MGDLNPKEMNSVTTIWIKANPLRRSNEAIREKLISEMPLGSSEVDVLSYIAQHDEWYMMRRGGYDSTDLYNDAKTHGDFRDYVRYGEPGRFHDPDSTVRYYYVIVGNYRTPPFFFVTSVSTFWRFDDNGRLFDVVIRKDTDAW